MLFEETLCLAVGNAHPRAGQKERMGAKEFEKESLVQLNSDFALRRIVDQYCRDNNIAPHIAIETDSLSVIIELIQVGPLATVLPKSIIRTQCGLYPIVLAPVLPNKAITLISRKGGYKSPACQTFIELAAEWSTRRTHETPVRKLRPCPMAEGYQDDNLKAIT